MKIHAVMLAILLAVVCVFPYQAHVEELWGALVFDGSYTKRFHSAMAMVKSGRCWIISSGAYRPWAS